MDPSEEGDPLPNSHQGNEENEEAFTSLIATIRAPRNMQTINKFLEKLEDIPEISLPLSLPCRAALSLAERGLVGQFTGIWPSTKSVQRWVERNWSSTINGKIAIRFYRRGYYTFNFETKEDKDLIFRNGPYFMDSKGLYLNHWTLDFNPEMDVLSAVPVWVRLPHLPLHCWGDESVKSIRNAVGKYIDRCKPKENMHACAKICVEVDLGKGLPEAIKIKIDQWMHIKQLDYEHIPFKCKPQEPKETITQSTTITIPPPLIISNPFGPLEESVDPPSPRSPMLSPTPSLFPPLPQSHTPLFPLPQWIVS
eukprot:PITA_31855